MKEFIFEKASVYVMIRSWASGLPSSDVALYVKRPAGLVCRLLLPEVLAERRARKIDERTLVVEEWHDKDDQWIRIMSLTISDTVGIGKP